jgi:hypothetical protein
MKTLTTALMLLAVLCFTQDAYSQSKSISKDFDGDGFSSYEHGGTDCNDLNFRINPQAKPSNGGTDNNCNGIVDYQEVVFRYGDINRSERIDVADLRIVLIEFGEDGASAADINHDKKVDRTDLEQMLDTYDTLTYGF